MRTTRPWRSSAISSLRAAVRSRKSRGETPVDGKMDACGVILAGGRSSRGLGRNKALLALDGKPLIQRQVERLSAWFRQVVIVTNTPGEYAFLGVPLVERPGARAPGPPRPAGGGGPAGEPS